MMLEMEDMNTISKKKHMAGLAAEELSNMFQDVDEEDGMPVANVANLQRTVKQTRKVISKGFDGLFLTEVDLACAEYPWKQVLSFCYRLMDASTRSTSDDFPTLFFLDGGVELIRHSKYKLLQRIHGVHWASPTTVSSNQARNYFGPQFESSMELLEIFQKQTLIRSDFIILASEYFDGMEQVRPELVLRFLRFCSAYNIAPSVCLDGSYQDEHLIQPIDINSCTGPLQVLDMTPVRMLNQYGRHDTVVLANDFGMDTGGTGFMDYAEEDPQDALGWLEYLKQLALDHVTEVDKKDKMLQEVLQLIEEEGSMEAAIDSGDLPLETEEQRVERYERDAVCLEQWLAILTDVYKGAAEGGSHAALFGSESRECLMRVHMLFSLCLDELRGSKNKHSLVLSARGKTTLTQANANVSKKNDKKRKKKGKASRNSEGIINDLVSQAGKSKVQTQRGVHVGDMGTVSGEKLIGSSMTTGELRRVLHVCSNLRKMNLLENLSFRSTREVYTGDDEKNDLRDRFKKEFERILLRFDDIIRHPAQCDQILSAFDRSKVLNLLQGLVAGLLKRNSEDASLFEVQPWICSPLCLEFHSFSRQERVMSASEVDPYTGVHHIYISADHPNFGEAILHAYMSIHGMPPRLATLLQCLVRPGDAMMPERVEYQIQQASYQDLALYVMRTSDAVSELEKSKSLSKPQGDLLKDLAMCAHELSRKRLLLDIDVEEKTRHDAFNLLRYRPEQSPFRRALHRITTEAEWKEDSCQILRHFLLGLTLVRPRASIYACMALHIPFQESARRPLRVSILQSIRRHIVSLCRQDAVNELVNIVQDDQPHPPRERDIVTVIGEFYGFSTDRVERMFDMSKNDLSRVVYSRIRSIILEEDHPREWFERESPMKREPKRLLSTDYYFRKFFDGTFFMLPLLINLLFLLFFGVGLFTSDDMPRDDIFAASVGMFSAFVMPALHTNAISRLVSLYVHQWSFSLALSMSLRLLAGGVVMYLLIGVTMALSIFQVSRSALAFFSIFFPLTINLICYSVLYVSHRKSIWRSKEGHIMLLAQAVHLALVYVLAFGLDYRASHPSYMVWIHSGGILVSSAILWTGMFAMLHHRTRLLNRLRNRTSEAEVVHWHGSMIGMPIAVPVDAEDRDVAVWYRAILRQLSKDVRKLEDGMSAKKLASLAELKIHPLPKWGKLLRGLFTYDGIHEPQNGPIDVSEIVIGKRAVERYRLEAWNQFSKRVQQRKDRGIFRAFFERLGGLFFYLCCCCLCFKRHTKQLVEKRARRYDDELSALQWFSSMTNVEVPEPFTADWDELLGQAVVELQTKAKTDQLHRGPILFDYARSHILYGPLYFLLLFLDKVIRFVFLGSSNESAVLVPVSDYEVAISWALVALLLSVGGLEPVPTRLNGTEASMKEPLLSQAGKESMLSHGLLALRRFYLKELSRMIVVTFICFGLVTGLFYALAEQLAKGTVLTSGLTSNVLLIYGMGCLSYVGFLFANYNMMFMRGDINLAIGYLMMSIGVGGFFGGAAVFVTNDPNFSVVGIFLGSWCWCALMMHHLLRLKLGKYGLQPSAAALAPAQAPAMQTSGQRFLGSVDPSSYHSSASPSHRLFMHAKTLPLTEVLTCSPDTSFGQAVLKLLKSTRKAAIKVQENPAKYPMWRRLLQLSFQEAPGHIKEIMDMWLDNRLTVALVSEEYMHVDGFGHFAAVSGIVKAPVPKGRNSNRLVEEIHRPDTLELFVAVNKDADPELTAQQIAEAMIHEVFEMTFEHRHAHACLAELFVAAHLSGANDQLPVPARIRRQVSSYHAMHLLKLIRDTDYEILKASLLNVDIAEGWEDTPLPLRHFVISFMELIGVGRLPYKYVDKHAVFKYSEKERNLNAERNASVQSRVRSASFAVQGAEMQSRVSALAAQASSPTDVAGNKVVNYPSNTDLARAQTLVIYARTIRDYCSACLVQRNDAYHGSNLAGKYVPIPRSPQPCPPGSAIFGQRALDDLARCLTVEDIQLSTGRSILARIDSFLRLAFLALTADPEFDSEFRSATTVSHDELPSAFGAFLGKLIYVLLPIRSFTSTVYNYLLWRTLYRNRKEVRRLDNIFEKGLERTLGYSLLRGGKLYQVISHDLQTPCTAFAVFDRNGRLESANVYAGRMDLAPAQEEQGRIGRLEYDHRASSQRLSRYITYHKDGISMKTMAVYRYDSDLAAIPTECLNYQVNILKVEEMTEEEAIASKVRIEESKKKKKKKKKKSKHVLPELSEADRKKITTQHKAVNRIQFDEHGRPSAALFNRAHPNEEDVSVAITCDFVFEGALDYLEGRPNAAIFHKVPDLSLPNAFGKLILRWHPGSGILSSTEWYPESRPGTVVFTDVTYSHMSHPKFKSWVTHVGVNGERAPPTRHTTPDVVQLDLFKLMNLSSSLKTIYEVDLFRAIPNADVSGSHVPMWLRRIGAFCCGIGMPSRHKRRRYQAQGLVVPERMIQKSVYVGKFTEKKARILLWREWRASCIEGNFASWWDGQLLRNADILGDYWRYRRWGRMTRASRELIENRNVIAPRIHVDSSRADIQSQFLIRMTDLALMVPGGASRYVSIDSLLRARGMDTFDVDDADVKKTFVDQLEADMSKALPDRLNVVGLDSGTWPADGGGVASCRRDVVDRLEQVQWHQISEIGNAMKLLRGYQIEKNVESLTFVPLWGVDMAGPVERVLASTSYHELALRPWITTDMVVERYFAPLVRSLVMACGIRCANTAQIEEMTSCIVNMYTYFQLFDWCQSWNHPTTLMVWRSLWLDYEIFCSADRNDAELPTVEDLDVALNLTVHFLTPLSVPLDPFPVFHATHHGIQALLGVIAKNIYGSSLVVWDHGILWRERIKAIGETTDFSFFVRNVLVDITRVAAQVVYCNADAIVSCSKLKRSNIEWERRIGGSTKGSQRTDLINHRISPIVNGMETDVFSPNRAAEEPRPTAVMLSHVYDLKDIKTAVRAAAIILYKFRVESFQLLVYGSLDKDLDYTQEVRSLILMLGVGSSVKLMGLGRASAVLPRGWVFVNSSKSEGLPLALGEAGLSGLPVVCTDVGGSFEVITRSDTNFQYGRVVSPQSPMDLARGILETMGMLGNLEEATYHPEKGDKPPTKLTSLEDYYPLNQHGPNLIDRIMDMKIHRRRLGMMYRTYVVESFAISRYLREHEQIIWLMSMRAQERQVQYYVHMREKQGLEASGPNTDHDASVVRHYRPDHIFTNGDRDGKGTERALQGRLALANAHKQNRASEESQRQESLSKREKRAKKRSSKTLLRLDTGIVGSDVRDASIGEDDENVALMKLYRAHDTGSGSSESSNREEQLLRMLRQERERRLQLEAQLDAALENSLESQRKNRRSNVDSARSPLISAHASGHESPAMLSVRRPSSALATQRRNSPMPGMQVAGAIRSPRTVNGFTPELPSFVIEPSSSSSSIMSSITTANGNVPELPTFVIEAAPPPDISVFGGGVPELPPSFK